MVPGAAFVVSAIASPAWVVTLVASVVRPVLGAEHWLVGWSWVTCPCFVGEWCLGFGIVLSWCSLTCLVLVGLWCGGAAA